MSTDKLAFNLITVDQKDFSHTSVCSLFVFLIPRPSFSSEVAELLTTWVNLNL